jgi:hypothetical protein
MGRLLGLVLWACSFAAAGSAFAAPLRSGQVEAGAILGAGSAATSPRAEYQLLRTLGFLLTDAWALGLQFGLAGDFESAPSSTGFVNVQYHHLLDGPLVPFLGAHVGLEADLFTSRPRVQDALGPDLGVKWLVGEQLLLIAQLRYTMQVSEPDRGIMLLCFGFSLLDEPIE